MLARAREESFRVAVPVADVVPAGSKRKRQQGEKDEPCRAAAGELAGREPIEIDGRRGLLGNIVEKDEEKEEEDEEEDCFDGIDDAVLLDR
jgi:hypothetical protein